MANKSKAEFLKWMPYVLAALREHGGSATPREVYDTVARLAKVTDEERYAKLNSGAYRYTTNIAFARQYLLWEGYLASPKHGLWMLTPKGQNETLTKDEAGRIFYKWADFYAKRRQAAKSTEPAETPPTEAESHKEEILSYLQSIPPEKFERFCADLLRQLGMDEVEVTGGRGDKGIDGEGYLRVGPLVSTKVAFQCKRYSGPVSAKEVREFQGAIGSRAEKGIFFTTGYFPAGAREAARDTTSKPIELIDGDRLVELLEQLKFGLRETKTYEVDYDFMSNYNPKGRDT